MSDAFQYDVFLSHSAKDKAKVRRLAERLRDDGLRVWFDEWEIELGDSIALKIEQGLERSRTLVLVMSNNAFASEWVSLERHTVLFRDPTNEQRRFIPLRLDDADPPDALRQFAYVDWRKRSGDEYGKLLAACRGPAAEELEAPEEGAAPESGLRAELVWKEGRHTEDVTDVAAHPDGERVISGSFDNTLKVWKISTGRCVGTFEGHTGWVRSVAAHPDGERMISGSADNTVKVWEISSGRCVGTFEGHTEAVLSVAAHPDGERVISGSADNTVKVWKISTGRCVGTFEGHTASVWSVAVHPDGERVISGSRDNTLKVWEISTGRCVGTFEGHTGWVRSVAVHPDGERVISGSADNTVKVWKISTGRCVGTFEGHTASVLSVAAHPDGERMISGSVDNTVKVWEISSGRCVGTFEGHTGWVRSVAAHPDGERVISGSADETVRLWRLSDIIGKPAAEADAALYTNAKVVLVGESGVGKTGLALRLCEDRWETTESTHGMLVSRLKLPPGAGPSGTEHEVWLWDFAGQPDYRLINQLYMDETALGVVVFDPQDDNPFDNIGYWEKALRAAAKYEPARLLVAARCDRGGITVSRKRFEEYVKEHGLAGFLCTGAKTGEGCEDLSAAIAQEIPWDRLPWTATRRLFKTLKDAILKLTEEDAPLVRLPELRQRLQLMLPEEIIGDEELRAVVGLMQGQGVVQNLDFGDFVLLQPEWVNRYASVVVRMAREHVDEMGTVPEQQVLDGRLEYKGMKRLAEADEKILLRAMVQTLLDRSLCLREQTPQGTMLVFPFYFRRDKPDLPEYPNVFVTYGFSGPLEDIYSTLVVRLSYSDGFKKDLLWKDAADFKTPGGKRVGLAMRKKAEGAAELVVYFEAGVPDETKVTFIKYVHEHLLARAQPRESVTRVRTYVCPHCNEPLENRKAIELRLKDGKKDIICGVCEERVPLLDLIEEKFASDEFLRKVREMDEQARINLDNESRELILVGHAMAIAGEAGQIYRIVPPPDWGIDAEIEFKNALGEASGQRVYLQLKSGNSYLYHRQRDDVEVFKIRKPRHARYWLSQAYPVMLVIRTSDGRIRWMDVTDYLRKHGPKTRQIIFEGQPLTAPNLLRLRDSLLGPPK